jgi:hypothetical protein
METSLKIHAISMIDHIKLGRKYDAKEKTFQEIGL